MCIMILHYHNDKTLYLPALGVGAIRAIAMAVFCFIFKLGATGPTVGVGCASDFFLFLSLTFTGVALTSFLLFGISSYAGAALANDDSSTCN